MFPDTPKTLLKRISQLASDDDAAEWEAFVELYVPPLRHFIRWLQPEAQEADIDDVLQDVFMRLVEVLREGGIDRSKGRFRAYLASMTRRILIDRYRAELARPQTGTVPSGMGTVPYGLGTVPEVGVMGIDPGAAMDIRWRMAVHEAAKNHILTKTAISEQSKAIYLAVEGGQSLHEGGQSLREVAEKFQVSYDVVKQVKSRIDRAIAAVEQRLSE